MDLRSGRAYWPLNSGLMHTYPPLTDDERADVLVIGAGITGALLADALTAAGLDVVVTDRRDVGFGSTAASTALLQYEIDTNLTDLTGLIGRRDAERAYMLCREAIDHVAARVQELPDTAGFQARGSLYYASTRKDARTLVREHAARVAAGLRVTHLDAAAVQARFGISAPGALFSEDGAEVDPYRLAHHLLQAARARGARVYDRTAVTRLGGKRGRGTLTAHTDRAAQVQASWVVVATGYEAESFLGTRLAQLKNSYALATEPLAPGELWPTGCLLWETARPYLYARTTPDGRILVGGEDDRHHDPARRERALPRKAERLRRRLERLLGRDVEVAFAWAGTFGETKDGLPFIGPQQKSDRLLFALGYGGNGITYSVQAARMLTAHIAGRSDPDMQIFRLDR